ncbi:rhomboid family intramembrane serine protease [Alteribacillus iranensis]|uniref:Membrane associated serine protease, rhomboid family n=1 Tax=Alteribacillus iranensis TaxID=930128 RepID=A0A1I2DEV4_9BACI|nr:rhomboid family intramembrane serine protease [Alteribacillus iranensis]SFE79034.1 Membrane associated serine protease, rhomboid family [Alteribacillus iranensis]
MFIRNETFYSFRKNYPLITGIVAIHFLLFLWMNVSNWTNGLIPLGGFIFQLGVGNNYAVATGEFWRLVTPIFLHIGAGHVLFNSFSLVLFGPALEKMLGKFKFLIAYLSAGILANIATFILTGPGYTHLGASGAIFGLFGIYLYMIWKRKDLIDAANAQLILVILILGVVMTFLNPGINITAHIFGLISGLALAPLFLTNALPFYAYPSTAGHGEATFRSSRWKMKRFSASSFIRIIGWGFIILVIIGIINRLLQW